MLLPLLTGAHCYPPISLPQLVWAALPGAETPAAAYVIQRWPTAAMPSPGQAGYLASVLHLQPPSFDASEGTYSATDSQPPQAGSPFYRVLALAPSGLPVAATRPSQAAASKGERPGTA
jgi:hypothetical protein